MIVLCVRARVRVRVRVCPTLRNSTLYSLISVEAFMFLCQGVFENMLIKPHIYRETMSR